jgi:hypothetical protein
MPEKVANALVQPVIQQVFEFARALVHQSFACPQHVYDKALCQAVAPDHVPGDRKAFVGEFEAAGGECNEIGLEKLFDRAFPGSVDVG